MKNIIYLLTLALFISCESDIEKLKKKGYSFTNDGFYRAYNDYSKDSTDIETIKLFLDSDKDSIFVDYMTNKAGDAFFTFPFIKPHPELVEYFFEKEYLDSSYVFKETGENLLHFTFGFLSVNKKESDKYYHLMELLIEKGCDLDNRNVKGLTLLLNAIKEENEKAVSMLLKNGANPNLIAQIEKFQVSPLLGAILTNKQNNIIKLLLEYKANAVDFVVDKSGYTSLFLYLDSFSKDSIDYSILELFIKQGVNIDKKNIDGKNPLYFAVSKNNTELVNFLLANGANPNMKYYFKKRTFSILQISAIEGNYDIVESLLNSGASKTYYSEKAYDNNGVLKRFNAYEFAKAVGNFKVAKLLKTHQSNKIIESVNKIPIDGSGMFSVVVVDKGFINSEISKYTVRIKRTSDLNGSYIYDEKREITHTSGFFGDDCLWYDIPFGYYKVRYYGYNKYDKKVFDITFKNILHKGNTIGEFPTDTEWNTPYIRHE